MDNTNFIMGRNTLMEVLKYKPEIIIKVFVNVLEKPQERKDDLMAEISRKKIPMEYVSKNTLFSIVHSESHQSFVAKIKPRAFVDLKEFFSKEKAFLLMLDNISDPQNLGALLRAAECFKVDGVIFSKNRGCDLTPVVAKASVGASELLNLIKVSNLSDSVNRLQAEGYEIIVADATENAKDLFNFTFPEKALLIMGAEGEGVQPLIKKKADHTVKIPLFGKIDSLNVSQATAVFLAFYMKGFKE
jgi:23S rRNA (guanosine2251-2'-O)-methyltransferase